ASWRRRAPPGATALPRTAPPRARPTRQGSRAAPYLRLIDSATHRAIEIREAVAQLGRSPDCTVERRTLSEARAYGITLLDAATGRQYEARGGHPADPAPAEARDPLREP